MDNVPRSPSALELNVGRELRDIGIPPCPTILLRVAHELRKPEPDFITLSQVIGDDVALSAGLVKVANSPYFGFQKKVRTVSEAMLVIGLKTICDAIAGLELSKAFRHIPNLERFWHSSAETAHMAAWLAMRLPTLDVRPADAYTYSLFHNCGIPILIPPFKSYLDVLRRANEEAESLFTQVEDDHFGVNHAVVGADMAKEWLLPEELCTGIRFHHDKGAFAKRNSLFPRASRQLIALSHLAEHLNHQHTGLNFSREWEKLGEDCLDILGIDDGLIACLRTESATAFSTMPVG